MIAETSDMRLAAVAGAPAARVMGVVAFVAFMVASIASPPPAVAAPSQTADDDPTPAGPPAIFGLDTGDDQGWLSDQEGAAGAATHTVRKGDTLWDISRAYFQDPWRWPKVWALNPEVTNPHWIFPGQAIRLRNAAGGPAAKDASATATPGAGLGSAGLASRSGSDPSYAQGPRQVGFVDEGTLKAAGFINGSLEEKIMLATGDHAYVEFPPGRPPKGGARYAVYRVDTDHPVKEPNSELVLGYLVRVYGEVVIDTLTDRPIANARLLDLSEPIERGYRVGPVRQPLRTVKPKKNAAEMTARIVASVQPNLLIADQGFVVLNRGQRHGVEAGNRFLVLRQGDGIKRRMEDWDTTDHRFPPHAVAEIVAVDVQNETTVGWISRATRELHAGDLADLRRGY